MVKNTLKTIEQAHYSCCVQKTDGKNTKYSRNETILKISHLAEAIDLAKRSVLDQKLKWFKTCEKRFYKHIRVGPCKKPMEKTPNIPEMRRF